jgi:histidinol dehydrogenase
VTRAPKVLVDAPDLDAALALSEALAPEHLELIGDAAEALAPRVSRAGCLFVGAASATAFGDYVAGSNHTLPTDGAARFASGLTVAHFRRRMSEVRIGDAAEALARAGVPIAEAEGFRVHAESMSARLRNR